MCKNGVPANRAVTELSITLRDDMNVSIPTSQWLLGMISAIGRNKMDALCRRMLKSTIKKGIRSWEEDRSHVGHRQTSDPIYRRRQAQ